jgi:broad specificity phosphatase PhoE
MRPHPGALKARPVLVLVRHGEAAGNAAGVLLGRTDSSLTARGRAQAAALRLAVGPVGHVVSSPLGRARDTAAALAPGAPVTVDERWIEVDYGELEGRELRSVPREVWARWRADIGFRPPGGETLEEVGARVRVACEELFGRRGEGARSEEDVVVVSHVSPIKAAVAWALGASDQVVWRLHLATASMTRIAWGADGPVLHRYNEVVAEPLP